MFTGLSFKLMFRRDVTANTRFLQYTDRTKTFKSEYNSAKVLSCTILRDIPKYFALFDGFQTSPSCSSDKGSINV
jgi:hypothetical protein